MSVYNEQISDTQLNILDKPENPKLFEIFQKLAIDSEAHNLEKLTLTPEIIPKDKESLPAAPSSIPDNQCKILTETNYLITNTANENDNKVPYTEPYLLCFNQEGIYVKTKVDNLIKLQTGDESTTDVEIDKEIDIEADKEIDIEEGKEMVIEKDRNVDVEECIEKDQEIDIEQNEEVYVENDKEIDTKTDEQQIETDKENEKDFSSADIDIHDEEDKISATLKMKIKDTSRRLENVTPIKYSRNVEKKVTSAFRKACKATTRRVLTDSRVITTELRRKTSEKGVKPISKTQSDKVIMSAETVTPSIEKLKIDATSREDATASPSPTPGEDTVTFESNFKNFAKFGDPKSDGRQITLSNSDKWMKQAKIIDGKKITTTDTGIYFKKLKSQKVTVTQYRTFLEDLAKAKKIEVQDVVKKLSSCGTPSLHGVGNIKATDTVNRLTDTSKYTGTHKQRFDETGKGKGISGRKDLVDGSGYVSGYQNKDTFEGKEAK